MDPSVNKEYDYIDGLRGVAILMVVYCHFVYFKESDALWNRILREFNGTLGSGVELFFTLSGFLISWPFWKRKFSGAEKLMPHGYGWRRFWKIYPPLALSVCLLSIFYIAWIGDAGVYLKAAVLWLTGLAFVVPTSGKFNPVMWSLVVEIHFYLVLPFIFLLTRRLSAKTCLILIPAVMFFIPLGIQHITGASPTFTPTIQDPYCTGLNCFFAGVAVAGVDNLKVWKRGWSLIGDAGWLLVILGLGGLAWARFLSLNPAGLLSALPQWTFAIGTGCLLFYAADPNNPRVRILSHPLLRWFGIISYEWYLFHQPMIVWFRQFVGGANGNVLKYVFILGVPLVTSLVFSALVYRFFSLPILRWGRARNLARPA